MSVRKCNIFSLEKKYREYSSEDSIFSINFIHRKTLVSLF